MTFGGLRARPLKCGYKDTFFPPYKRRSGKSQNEDNRIPSATSPLCDSLVRAVKSNNKCCARILEGGVLVLSLSTREVLL